MPASRSAAVTLIPSRWVSPLARLERIICCIYLQAVALHQRVHHAALADRPPVDDGDGVAILRDHG